MFCFFWFDIFARVCFVLLWVAVASGEGVDHVDNSAAAAGVDGVTVQPEPVVAPAHATAVQQPVAPPRRSVRGSTGSPGPSAAPLAGLYFGHLHGALAFTRTAVIGATAGQSHCS